MSNKLIMDLDNTITIDESASVYESKKPNLEVRKASEAVAATPPTTTKKKKKKKKKCTTSRRLP